MKNLIYIVLAACSIMGTVAQAAEPAPIAAAKLALPGLNGDFGVSMGFTAANDKLCLLNSDYDGESGKSSVHLMALDWQRHAIRWSQRITPPDHHAMIYPRQCLMLGDEVYFLANADTRTEHSLKHSHAYIYRFDAQGKQLGYQRIDLPGRNQFAYAMGVNDGKLQVAGYLMDEDDNNEYYSLFTVGLQPDLKLDKPIIRKTGAFAADAEARIVGDSLYIGGDFLKAKLGKEDSVFDYANSRINLNGGYAWSARPLPIKIPGMTKTLGADGSVYGLGSLDGKSFLTVTGPDGKARTSATYQSKFCDIQALSGQGDALFAIRNACKGKGSVLLKISLANGQETPLSWVSGEPQYVAVNAGQWFVVSRSGNGKLTLQSGTIIGEQAFDGEVKFVTAEKDGLTHTLVLSQWKKDGRGVPSFDYEYEQRAGTCRFRLTGHAIADFQEEGGVLKFDVFNPEDEHGKEMPPILTYGGNGVSFSLPEKGPVREVGLAHKLKPDELASFCGSKDTKKLRVAFQRR